MIYLALTHMSSEGQNSKTVLDGDTDKEVLRTRLNAYMASPRMVNYNRQAIQQIPEGQDRSPIYHGSGGGCHYSTWLTIEELKPLVVT